MGLQEQDGRIRVEVITGFLGSGKTTLLNRLLREPAFAGSVVIVNEYGDVGVDHHLVRPASDRVVLVEGGCLCCAVSGDVADALRDLFMQALRRAIPPFRRVFIETSGLADPASVIFTLRHDRFLPERNVYTGCVAVVDARQGARRLAEHPEAVRQLALADAVVFSKADLAGPSELAEAERAASAINPGARRAVHVAGSALPGLLAEPLPARRSPAELRSWLGAYAGMAGSRHAPAGSCVVALDAPLPRARFLSGVARVQERFGDALLRLKGWVAFQGETLPMEVQGVHGELYPLAPLPGWPEGEGESRLVAIVRGECPETVRAALQEVLSARG